MVAFKLAKPVQNTQDQFKKYFPKAPFLGTIGDARHLKGSGDHTPWASDRIGGKSHQKGTVYAADLGNGPGFSTKQFQTWLLTQLKAGKYPEVKYMISNYQLNDRRYGWKNQRGSDGPGHVHLSFMPGHENTTSTILQDYHNYLTKPKPVQKVAPKAPTVSPVPIKALTKNGGKVIGQKVPNARVVPANAAPVLSLGAKDDQLGGWVTYAENKLGVPVNGYYGPEMTKAVKDLQKRRGLPTTGRIDATTWRSLGHK